MAKYIELSLQDAIWSAFVWYESKEGNDYWLTLANKYN